MKIYRISPHSEDDQVYIDFETALDWDFISNVLDGVKVSEGDVNNSMRLKDKNRVVPDILGTSSADFLMSEKVKVIIENNVKELDINFVPFNIEEHNFWLLNVIGHLDCFDYELSDYSKGNNGKPNKIFDLKFKTELIPEFAIFRIEEDDVSLFITEKLKNLLDQVSITGVAYTENMNLTKEF